MVVGRSAERARIDRLIEEGEQGRSGALVVRGEPGIGKTTLLQYAADRASDMQILRALGVEAESEFAFSGLHELLHPVLSFLDQIPEVQAEALRGALALDEPRSAGRLYIGAATLSLLSSAASEEPLLCLIDDANWIDRASADALTFAARRLEAEGIVMVFTTEEGEERPFLAPGVPELRVSGLNDEEAATLLRTRLSDPIAPNVVASLVEETGGNPLALVEIPPLLTNSQRAGKEPLPHPLPVGAALERAFAVRSAELSDVARKALLLASAADTRGVRVIATASDEASRGLEECEEAGLVNIREGQVLFRHPLLRSAVYHAATPAERRAAHRLLAAAFAREEQYAERGAWHAAASVVGPDEDIAKRLEEAAEGARARRGHAAAAALYQRAARLSQEDGPRRSRLYEAAASEWAAGQPDRADRLLEEATGTDLDPHLQSKLDHLRGRIELLRGSRTSALQLLTAGADRVEPLDPEQAALMLADAVETAPSGDRLALARRAQTLSHGRGGGAELLAVLVLARELIDEGVPGEARTVLEQARSILDRDDELRRDPEILLSAVEVLTRLEEPEALVREMLEDATAAARQHSIAALPRGLFHLAWLNHREGRWAEAYVQMYEALRLSEETGQLRQRAMALAGTALMEALQGREGECRARVADLWRSPGCETEHVEDAEAQIRAALAAGFGEPVEVVASLEALTGRSSVSALLPRDDLWRVDLIEAMMRLGRKDDATEVLDGLEARRDQAASRDIYRAWAKALVAPQEETQRGFSRTLKALDSLETDRPFIRARVHLNRGERTRRTGGRIAAREDLRPALDGFERLGALSWAERARRELRATGERVRRQGPTTMEELTAQELQVARVIARGATYKETAAKLFLSPKTVEFHMSKVYRKLGIDSRRQLASRLTAEGLLEAL